MAFPVAGPPWEGSRFPIRSPRGTRPKSSGSPPGSKLAAGLGPARRGSDSTGAGPAGPRGAETHGRRPCFADIGKAKCATSGLGARSIYMIDVAEHVQYR